jgi:transglutaminase-like putative cysteine protease
MENNIKNFCVLLLLLVITQTAFCGKTKPDAVYHLIRKEFKINEDGSTDMRFRKEMQLFSYDAFFHTYGETFIPYNTDFQTLTINEAYTVRKDGSKVETPANAFNPSLPAGCTDCERFNTIREMVVTHTALEYDATIVLDYTIHTEANFLGIWMERVDLCEPAPVERYEVSVTLPAEYSIQYMVNCYGRQVQPTKDTQSVSYTLSWVFQDLPQRPADAYLPYDYLPYMMMTTVADPTAFMSELMFQNAFVPGAKNFSSEAAAITKDCKSDLDKMLALRNYVADMTHTNNVSLKQMNYIVASPATVWQTNCGSRVDKDVLLATLLDASGLQAEFGLLYGNLMRDAESAVKVTIQGETYFISSAVKSTKSLSVLKAGDTFLSMQGQIVPFPKPTNSVDVAADIDVIMKDGAPKAEVRVRRSDVQSPARSSMRPVSRTPSVSFKNMGSGYYEMTLPADYGCDLQASRIAPDRTLPVEVVMGEENYSYTITLPAGARCLTKPYKIEQSSEFGSVMVELTCDGRTLTVNRKLSLKQPFISGKKNLRRLRDMLVVWETNKRIVFKNN